MIASELRQKVADFEEMEQRSGSMQVITPVYVARCMQISQEHAADALKILNM